jgi:replicative DNA helicase Mcm
MELQELPVDKAGISARFPARTSVLMLANPQFGRISEGGDMGQQIKFPETTLSRLDLKFIVQDKPEETRDKFIFQRMSKPSETVVTIPKEFLMKYIQYASVLNPQMTDEALEKIEEYFLKLRASSINANTVQITPRQGEAIMRLAEAYAKIRLSEKVEVDDSSNAIRIFTQYLQTFGLVDGTTTIDIDKAEGRPSKEKRDKMTIIVDTIRRLIEENNGLPIAREHLMNACKKEGLDETFLEKTIDSLITQGVFYSPTQNYLMMYLTR